MVLAIGTNVTSGPINYQVISKTEVEVGHGIYAQCSAVSRDYSENIVIPLSITSSGNKYEVTVISSHAFYCCSLIKSVVLPYSIRSIEYSGFGAMTSLCELIIPTNTRLKFIGRSFIHLCDNLKNFIIPGTVTTLDEGMFNTRTPTNIWYCRPQEMKTTLLGTKFTIHVPPNYHGTTFGGYPIQKDSICYINRCTQCYQNISKAYLNQILVYALIYLS